MSITLFKVEAGLADGNVSYLSGSAAPGGDASFQDNAGQGSSYLRSDGSLYLKTAAGTGADKWGLISTQAYTDSVVNGQSWREPVLANETTLRASVTAAESAANIGDTVDGVTIAVTDRILLSNLTAGNENVYIVSGSTGAWTFTEDTNAATTADALRVIGGTDAGKAFTYNGSAWIYSNQAASDEEGYIRTFVGKTGSGSETPTYSSTNVVTTTNSLETAVGDLDAEFGAAIATAAARTAGAISDQAVNLNVEALDDAVGPNVTSTNFAVAASAVNANISNLDSKLGAAVSNGLVVLAANSSHSNIQALDTELDARVKQSTAAAVTTAATLDSVLVDNYKAVKWLISVEKVADATAKYAVEVLALHNGTSAADATSLDWNEAGIVQVGAAISGLDISVDINGATTSQTMRLRVVSTDSVNVTATRLRV